MTRGGGAVQHVAVSVPWDRTGAVMRGVLDGDHAGEVVLVDGIKVVHEAGWVLVAPDLEVPVVNITVEAVSPDIAVRFGWAKMFTSPFWSRASMTLLILTFG